MHDDVASVVKVRWRLGQLVAEDQIYLGGANEARVQAVLPNLFEPWGSASVEDLTHNARHVHELALAGTTGSAHRTLVPGRWYPAELFVDAPDGVHLGQLLHVNGAVATVDCNHPLSRAEVDIDVAEIAPLPSVRGRREPALAQKLTRWLCGGVGLQAYPLPELFDSPVAHTRQDEADDAVFYAPPRLVQHIDSWARSTIARWYAEPLVPGAQILDLMSSWVTHLPASRNDLQVDGLGMNEVELSRNPRLRSYVVHDLNRMPDLPEQNVIYDAALCSVSVEYLADPVAVFAAVATCLRPGGHFVNAFSNRCFPTKAVALWAHLQPFERMAFVAHLYARSGAYGPCEMRSMCGAPRPPDDDYAAQMADADPVYLVAAPRC